MARICGVDDLDVVIVDFEHGPQGMTLLRAIRALRENTPVVVITVDDQEHVEALAYANGATVCLSKQAVTTELANTIQQLCSSQPGPVFA
jgi:DNA-binding NarL/FixJ family response regulator